MGIRHYLALASLTFLVACGGGDEQTLNPPRTPGSLVYAYPADGQAGVSPSAHLVLRFSDAITDKNPAQKIKLTPFDGDDNSSQSVDFSVRTVDGGKSLVLTPDSKLAVGTQYTVRFPDGLAAAGGRTMKTPNATGPDGIQFTTRGSFSGVASLANLSDEFKVVGMLPDGEKYQFMDFSTLELRTSQPIAPETAVYGTSVSLLDNQGKLVPATLLVKGNHLTIDPCTTAAKADCGSPKDKLSAGEKYTLRIDGISNLKGEGGSPGDNDGLQFEKTFRPQKSGPTTVLYQKVVTSGSQSILNGETVNAVTLNSVLQGTAGPSQQSGSLYAELAYAPSFPGDTPVPLRIPRGTVLTSSSLDVLINGRVPLIDESEGNLETTGPIDVTMISDAIGYLFPNPYSDDDEAPRHVRLFMDVAMNTGEDQPNASLSQDLMRVQLTGIASVRNDKLTIDAIGMVEPNLLGQEYTDSTIAFRLEADTSHQYDAPPRPKDQTGPDLVSWMPGNDAGRQSRQRPGDPVILNMNEPLDADTLDTMTLTTSDGKIPIDTRLDGTAVAINPPGGLKHGVDYTLKVPDTVTDLAGNGYTGPKSLTFSLPPLADESDSSPLAVTTYPGFPCVTTGRDLLNNLHGRCAGLPENSGDESMPVTTMPADRPITVVFSQSMNRDSIKLGETFTVEKVTSLAGDTTGDSAQTTPVSGRLEVNKQRLRFYPDEPWEKGTYYRYTMASQASETPDCSSAICSDAGQALETNALAGLSKRGGPDMSIYFKGAAPVKSVFNPLRNLPVRDVNADSVIECPLTGDGLAYDNDSPNCIEPIQRVPDGQGGFAEPQSTRIISAERDVARVGCKNDDPDACTELKYIYQTGGLNSEFVGPVDPDDPSAGVRVNIYPTLLTTSSLSVFAKPAPALPFLMADTKKQVLRLRYADVDNDGKRRSMIPGVIKENEAGKPVFKADVDIYLDAPELELPIPSLTHNLHSVELTLDLSGRVKFLEDGRTVIEQFNKEPQELRVEIGTTPLTKFKLKIPQNGVRLTYLSNPIKDLIAPPKSDQEP